MSIRVAPAFAACVALLSCTTAWPAQKRLDRTFTVEPGGRLTVQTDGGDITVTGVDSNQAHVQIVADGSKCELSAEQTSDGIAVTAKDCHSGWLGWLSSGGSASVTVQVPRRYDVELNTSGGDLSAAGLQGDVNGKTSGGDIRVNDVTGAVRMRTSGGDVTLEAIRGTAYLRSSGGDLVAREIGGDTDAKTSGGSIRLSAVTGNTRASTSSGDVVATDIRGDADLHTSGGNIDARQVDGRIRAATSGGNVLVELSGTNRGISATSTGGNIVLRVPKDVAADLNASTSGGSVRSDLPVSTTQAAASKLRGTINGGGAEIVARTSGGNITLHAR